MQNYEYIIAIVEEQNLLRAAERLFISPSALSQAVSKLEDSLKTPLFTRSRSGWIPTDAGHLYIDMAKKIVEIERQTFREIAQLSSDISHTITLGISPGRITDMLANCFPLFNARFPNIKLTLIESPVEDNIKNLLRHKIDIAFLTSCLGFDEIEELRVRPLKNENFVIATPISPLLEKFFAVPTYPFPTISLKQMVNYEFILMQKGTTVREAEDVMFETAGYEPNVIFESSSIHTIQALAHNGYATTLLPSAYAVPSNKTAYFFFDETTEWTLYAACRSSHKLSVPEEYMLTLAAAYYRDH